MKTPVALARLIAKHLGENVRSTTLRDITPADLDALWAGGEKYVLFSRFVDALAREKPLPVQWIDHRGDLRTTRSVWKGPFRRTIFDLDNHSDERKLAGVSARRFKIRPSYSMVNPAAALALVCLINQHYDNFARIVAASPKRLVRHLLDKKAIRPGPAFTECTIWKAIAYALPELRERGNAINEDLEALSYAMHNFLSYHKAETLEAPVSKLTKIFDWHYPKGLFALANNPLSFHAIAEMVWSSACSGDKRLETILSAPLAECEIDASLVAMIMNIVFSGIDINLKKAVIRKEYQSAHADATVKAAAAAGETAVKSAPVVEAVGEVTSGIVAMATEKSAKKFGAKISSLNVHSDFEEMRKFFASVYSSLGDNAEAGCIVACQRILETIDLEALLVAKPEAGANRSEVESSPESPLKRLIYMEDAGMISANLTLQERGRIVALRKLYGKNLQMDINKIGRKNSYTPSLSLLV